MFYLRLLLTMLLLLSVNVFVLGVVFALPVLQPYRPYSLIVTGAVLVLADAVVLFLLYLNYRWVADRYRKFEHIVNEISGSEEPDLEDYQKAHERWKDEK